MNQTTTYGSGGSGAQLKPIGSGGAAAQLAPIGNGGSGANNDPNAKLLVWRVGE